MKLLNQVKDKLAEKGYDFESEFFTDEMLTLVYDVVYATEEVLKPKETPECSERKKATFAFFDKLPDGLREMAKENYTEIASTYVPTTLTESVGHGFLLPSDALNKLFVALSRKSPSITLNGITYDLTKCYE